MILSPSEVHQPNAVLPLQPKSRGKARLGLDKASSCPDIEKTERSCWLQILKRPGQSCCNARSGFSVCDEGSPRPLNPSSHIPSHGATSCLVVLFLVHSESQMSPCFSETVGLKNFQTQVADSALALLWRW